MKKCTVWFIALLLSFSLFSLDAEAAGLKDLESSERFFDEISYLIDEGVISGYADGTFKPSKAVTRGEAVIMIGRLLNLDGSSERRSLKMLRNLPRLVVTSLLRLKKELFQVTQMERLDRMQRFPVVTWRLF